MTRMAQYQTQQIGPSDLVNTKLVPPQLRPQLVSRTALLGRLDAALNCKLTLVSAPAGFGKSTLGRLTAPLCDVPLDEAGQWYRYHALFAESVQHVARRRLGEAAVAKCCNRASIWYEQQGLLAEAIEAAFTAKAFARAATLIERMIGPAHFQEQLEYHTVRRWLGMLPQTVLAQHLRLCLRFALLTLFSAAGVTLLAGIVMIAVSGLGVPLWVIWGFAALLISMALGATLIRRDGDKLSEVAATAAPGDARLSALQQRLTTLNIINVIVLLSAVWAMVFKPQL
jgi:hypothetical protein